MSKWGSTEAGGAPDKALQELEAKRSRGEITAFELESRKKALLAGAASTQAAAAPPPPVPPPPVIETPKAPAPEPPKPAGWGSEGRSAPKTWSAGARTDDPTKRVVHPPTGTGPGDGKSFLFLFGLKKHSPNDQSFVTRETENIKDDLEVLTRNGFTVVVDLEATKADFLDGLAGQGEGVKGLVPAGVYWSAHGNEDGSIETSDGGLVKPADCDPAKVSPGLKLLVFGSCYVGSRARTWRKQLGGNVLVVGWGRPVTIDRAVEFLQSHDDTETDFDDLVKRYLLEGAPVPPEIAGSLIPGERVSSRARKIGLGSRPQEVAERLGGALEETDGWFRISVPLEDGRRHSARLFVVDSTAPFSEGEPLACAEAEVGEMTPVVDLSRILASANTTGYARVALTKGETEPPKLVALATLPLARVKTSDLTTLVYQVCSTADRLEREVFGGDYSR